MNMQPPLKSLALAIVSACQIAHADTCLVDFARPAGNSAGTADSNGNYWNDFNTGTSISTIADTTNTDTSIGLTLGGGFPNDDADFGGSAFNTNDTGAPAPFNVATAFGDGLYSDDTAGTGVITLNFSGLAANTLYDIALYGGGRNDGRWADGNLTVTTGTGSDGTVTEFGVETLSIISNAAGVITFDFQTSVDNVPSHIVALSITPVITQARSININLYNNAGIADNNQLDDGESAGVIPIDGPHWNNIGFNNGDLSGTAAQRNLPLRDDSGNNSAATFISTLQSAYVGYSGASAGDGGEGNQNLMSSYLCYKPEDNGKLQITGLGHEFTSVGYDVYVYFDTDSANRSHTLTLTPDGGAALVRKGDDSGTYNGEFVLATGAGSYANVAKFENLTAASFTLDMQSSIGRAAVNGIQIVNSKVARPPSITSFTASDHYLSPGEQVQLSWQVEGSTDITIDQGVGDVTSHTSNGSGSITLSTPASSTYYTLTAYNGSGTATASLRLDTGPPRPNIVFFLVDDMGPQDTSVPFCLDADGHPKKYNFNNFYQTPNMETLASQGVRFTTAYAQSVCSPTRTGLMTGQNSARHAVTDWVGSVSSGSPDNWRRQGIDHTDITLPKILRQGGYHTIHVGKAHFGAAGTTGADPLNLGFDVNIGGFHWGHPHQGFIGEPAYGGMPGLEAYDGSLFLTKALTIEANRALEDAVALGRPFFLNMSFYAVHSPFTTNPDATGDYSGSTGSTHTKFATMIEGMDIAIGEIRQKLIDLGVARDTLIIFLGDNGSDSPATTVDGLPSGNFNDFPMRGKKGSKWEGGYRIPMITCWAQPDADNPFQQSMPIPANSIETDIVTSWDLPATCLAAAGLDAALGFGEDSHSLLPYMVATPGTHRPQELVLHYPHNHRSDYFSLLRQGDMKLIYNYQNNSHQLYNLADDPSENNDLASSQPETTMRMARALAQTLDATWGSRGPLIPTVSTTAPNGNVVSIPDTPDIDTDIDGIPDITEDPNRNGLIDPGETDPDNDNTDGDNAGDGIETRLGLDPLDPASYFFLMISPDKSLTWPSAPGSRFTIRSSTDLIDWSNIVATGLSAEPGAAATSFTPPATSAPHVFYRVSLDE